MKSTNDPRIDGTPVWEEKSLEDKKEQLIQLINMVGVDVFVEEHVRDINQAIFIDPDTFGPFLKGKIEFHWDIERVTDVHAIKGDAHE